MLTLEDVRKNYGSFSLQCSFQVAAGRITGLVGGNGAGKRLHLKQS